MQWAGSTGTGRSIFWDQMNSILGRIVVAVEGDWEAPLVAVGSRAAAMARGRLGALRGG